MWLVSKYKNSFFLFLSRFVLLILDSSSEAATRGVIQKQLFQKYCNIHCYGNIQFTGEQTAVVDYQNKVTLISILILKAIDCTKKSKRFTSQPSLQAFKRYISDMTFFHRTAEFRRFFCNSGISLICLIHLSLSNLYFYTIRSLTMFTKVLNQVNFKVLTQT